MYLCKKITRPTSNKMKKILTVTIITLLCIGNLLAKDNNLVWNKPTTEYSTSYGDGFFNLALDINKVELKDAETLVYITARERPDDPEHHSFQFSSDTYLKVGETRYKLLSADGIELNKFVSTHRDGTRNMVFHFQPIPKTTKTFDFIEGDGEGAFQIKGIKPVEERWKQIIPSYWRDENDGEWKIAFLDSCAIYKCQFWDYKQCDVNPKTGEANIVMTNGKEELKVVIGKNKKGKRNIHIDNQGFVYSMITDRFMPDYPIKDTRSNFVDNGYKNDTITVVGWIKDMPTEEKNDMTFSFAYQENPISGKQIEESANMDDQGRFTIKIPVRNSTEFFCDWSRCFVRTMLEPGKTYFMLYDFKEGRRFFMGDDVRLQNELFRFPLDWNTVSMEKGGDFDKYIASTDSLIKAQYTYIDSLCDAHPTLSVRFSKYRKGNTLWQQANEFAQAKFVVQNHQLTDNARKYAYDTFWTKLDGPYSLHRNLLYFTNYYLSDITNSYSHSLRVKITDFLSEIAQNDEEMAILTRWKKFLTEAENAINAEPNEEIKQKLADDYNAKNEELIEKAEKILNSPKASRVLEEKLLITKLQIDSKILDSLKATPSMRNIYLSHVVYDKMEHDHRSLSKELIDSFKTMTTQNIGWDIIENMNNRYISIENGDFDKLVIKSPDNLKDLSKGEAILKEILKPFKGKFVLLDIWGTWCGPCKEALSHSEEEYKRLSKYDIQYLYLANHSPKDSWENIIKEYKVTGSNVAHYNLPEEQQSAIEGHLKIAGYPTYKLFDREGNLLDIDIDARNLDVLDDILKRLSENK